MANDYFNHVANRVSAGTRAISANVNDVADEISIGLDKLPTENELKLGLTRYAVDSGVADAYVLTMPYTPTLTDGFNLLFKAVNANTGASTVNVNGLGAKSIVNPDGSALISGTFGSNAIVIIAYESIGDRFILVSQNPAQAALAQSSAIAAAASAGDASTSEGNAATSESNALGSANSAGAAQTAAEAAQTAAELAYDSFDDRYLGSKASDPTLDNDGNALLTGALYWNSTGNLMKAYNGATWADVASDVSKVGTPINDQVGVWTGDGTIEGTAGLTFGVNHVLQVGDGSQVATAINVEGTATANPAIRLYQSASNRATMQFVDSGDVLQIVNLVGPIELRPNNGTPGSITVETDGALTLIAANTAHPSLNVPHGTAPTTPANGDIWSTTAGFFARINGATVDLSANNAPWTYTLQTGTTYTAVVGDFVAASNTGAVTITLPSGHSVNDTIIVKKTGSGGTVTVDGNASETIDGALTFPLTALNASITLISDGTNWLIV
ncbi:MAG: hypothetical protein OEN02_03180 [Gammaproteobacteria bacterium]|nr:hypothetical protein [Gammaproteobacteria bacterium]